MRSLRGMLLVVGLVLIGLLAIAPLSSHAATGDPNKSFQTEEVSFKSGGVTLHGTILIPEGDGRRPAMALIQGAGLGLREDYRREAEAFARKGIVTLIYDKRTEGYSQFSRSYELLADDALAAVRVLRARPDVDPDSVGLWGLSEGGWVVPLAAADSDEVSFVVLVGASGVPPAQQDAWNFENELRHRGVSGSVVYAATRDLQRLFVAAEMFPEATHDPVSALEDTQQPVLAIWGDRDRNSPPAESARIVREALERGGNDRYTLRFIPNADHDLRASPDGFEQLDTFAPGYLDTVTSWVNEVSSGEMPVPSAADPPRQERLSPATVLEVPWYESGGWLQLISLILLIAAFATYLAIYLATSFGRLLQRRRSSSRRPTPRAARWLAGSGLATVLGLFGYLGAVSIAGLSILGPIFFGRPLPWLGLQGLAVTTCVLTASLAMSCWAARDTLSTVEKTKLGALLFGGALFVPWAVYWNLLIP